MFTKVISALKSHYRRTGKNSMTFDTLEGLIGLIVTSLALWSITHTPIPIDDLHLAVIVGVLKGGQIYLGLVMLVSIVAILVESIAPYRHVFATMLLTLAVIIIPLTNRTSIGFDPVLTGEMVILLICSYRSCSHLFKILFSQSNAYVKTCQTQRRRSTDRIDNQY